MDPFEMTAEEIRILDSARTKSGLFFLLSILLDLYVLGSFVFNLRRGHFYFLYLVVLPFFIAAGVVTSVKFSRFSRDVREKAAAIERGTIERKYRRHRGIETVYRIVLDGRKFDVTIEAYRRVEKGTDAVVRCAPNSRPVFSVETPSLERTDRKPGRSVRYREMTGDEIRDMKRSGKLLVLVGAGLIAAEVYACAATLKLIFSAAAARDFKPLFPLSCSRLSWPACWPGLPCLS